MDNFWNVLRQSLKNMLSKPLWLLLVLTVCITSTPYLGRTIDDLPVAVIDMDHSSASRELARMLDAAPKIGVRAYADLPSAQADLAWRQLFAIIVIPLDFEKRLLRGEQLVVPVFGDATNRMANGQIQQDINATYNQLLRDHNGELLERNGFSTAQTQILLDPLVARLVDLYNPGTSFAAIVLPGLVTLILQHGLLLSSTRVSLNLRGGTPRSLRQPLSTRLGRCVAQLLIWVVLAMLLYVIWPHIFGFRQTASFWALLGIVLPFLLAVLAFSEFLAELLPSEEAVYLTLTFVTLPLFYLAGYTWPPQAMPDWVLLLANAIPSTWTIRAVAEMNQMNLPLSAVGQHILVLLAMAAGYALLGTLLYQWRNWRTDRKARTDPATGNRA
ncbi:ABC transporter permease [Pseudomonas sp.]|uniref:ABC transporter permease n=1 Tax=Pseudomonas sp. TaxID=306 RepID=UPI0028AFF893|nr:ABC transporter permease [Pseudomonas sp.]